MEPPEIDPQYFAKEIGKYASLYTKIYARLIRHYPRPRCLRRSRQVCSEPGDLLSAEGHHRYVQSYVVASCFPDKCDLADHEAEPGPHIKTDEQLRGMFSTASLRDATSNLCIRRMGQVSLPQLLACVPILFSLMMH